MNLKDMSFKKAMSYIWVTVAWLFLLAVFCWMFSKYAVPMLALAGIAFVLLKPEAIKSFGVKTSERVWAVVVFTTIFAILQALLGTVFELPVGILYDKMTTPDPEQAIAPGPFAMLVYSKALGANVLAHMVILAIAWMMTKQYLNPVGGAEVVAKKQARQRAQAIFVGLAYLFFALTPMGSGLWGDMTGRLSNLYTIAGGEMDDELALYKLNEGKEKKEVLPLKADWYSEAGVAEEKLPKGTKVFTQRVDTNDDGELDSYEFIEVSGVKLIQVVLASNLSKVGYMDSSVLGKPKKDEPDRGSDGPPDKRNLANNSVIQPVDQLQFSTMQDIVFVTENGWIETDIFPESGDVIDIRAGNGGLVPQQKLALVMIRSGYAEKGRINLNIPKDDGQAYGLTRINGSNPVMLGADGALTKSRLRFKLSQPVAKFDGISIQVTRIPQPEVKAYLETLS